MGSDRSSPHSHGRSEVFARPAVARAIRREKKRLGAHLLRLRTARGLTQEAAAEAVGIHAKHLGRIESGAVNVSLATLVAIARAYRIHIHELFIDETQKG